MFTVVVEDVPVETNGTAAIQKAPTDDLKLDNHNIIRDMKVTSTNDNQVL